MHSPATHRLAPLLDRLRAHADDHDRSGEWPADDLRALRDVGAFRWSIPREFGGEDLPPLDVHLGYESLARASLNLALILSQRDSAVGMIDGAEAFAGRGALLSELARGDTFATIGIAQLTTSRQGLPPVLRATPDGDGFRLNGYIPWSTGAAKANFVVAGATVDTSDGGQILFLLPIAAGVRIDPPMPLVALRASWTTQIDCENVHIAPDQLLRGPVPSALAGRKKGVPLGQAFLALGLSQGGLDLIAAHTSAGARRAGDQFAAQLTALRTDVLRLCDGDHDTEAAEAAPLIRGRCNDLAMRITHAAVALYKGSALVAGHPAQRLAREAMFLLVWSCPNPVIDCTVDLLSGERT
jgi:alkylation response protein AidB-like acyl-CoA dehydrogenase